MTNPEQFPRLQKLVQQWTGVIHENTEYTYIHEELALLKSVTKKDWVCVDVETELMNNPLLLCTSTVRFYCEADDPIRTIQLDDIKRLSKHVYEVLF